MKIAFWKRKKPQTLELPIEELQQPFQYDDTGILYPVISSPKTDADFYWQSLEDEELAYLIDDHYVLAWDNFFLIQQDLEHQHTLYLFNLPQTTNYVPMIRSEEALSDPDFKIVLDGWCDAQGSKVRQNIKRQGAVIQVGEADYLVSASTWKLLDKIREFARLTGQKDQSDNQKYWAKIRSLALTAQANLDDFLRKTIVLAPEKLQINMRRNMIGSDPVVEVQPDFIDAPQNWLEKFDQYQNVQDSYSINLPDGGIAHVIIDSKVKHVLDEIKRMPNRRVSGERAQMFLRNPYAQLGEDATEVIEPASFEQSKQKAEIYSYSLSIDKFYNDHDIYSHAQLILTECSERETPPINLELKNIEQTQYFIDAYYKNDLVFIWAGYDIDRSQNLVEQIAALAQDLKNIQAYEDEKLTATVLDLANYSERVIGIGEAEKLHSEFIQRDSGVSDWVPQNLANHQESTLEPAKGNFSAELEKILNDAQQQGENTVKFPHLDQEMTLNEAQELIGNVKRDEEKKKLQSSEKPAASEQKKHKMTLLIANNIDTAEYSRQRADQLFFDESNLPAARLPTSFRQHEFSLKQHQEYGVAWLQNLHQYAPAQVSGCLLADDMGLGKTLQLLCFIGEYLESQINPKPILIVAPVSLLENWEAEANRFFSAKFANILSLYGDNLKHRKMPKQLISQKLRDENGITNLLENGWRGDANIVLTTYETMRDLEFSLAREDWAIMVCDEAQKIKVPTAMVTKAAKAQKADFKIACTGTPVENSLTDLWCLFDFIQENLLGPLNEFGRNYRKPIENVNGVDQEVLEQLRKRIEPQVLRRMKSDVADLPRKNDDPDPSCKKIQISNLQLNLYTHVVNQYKQLSSEGNHSAMLGSLHQMRMICAHPLYYDQNATIHDSPKVKWLIETLKNIQNRGEKVIIFTEFRAIQIFLQRILMEQFGLNVSTVNGDSNTSSSKGLTRQNVIDRFQHVEGFNIIILSTTAVGFGVNIQKANHVIHYTRSWNPAKEDQATDRAYRIGQDKEVFVYYPSVYTDEFETFELKLDRLLSDKRRLADDMLMPSTELSKDLMREI